ncbi:hypothetical protein [Kitasatospora sp. CMC57]
MSVIGWIFGHVFAWWMAYGTVVVSALILAELRFCRQYGRRQLPFLRRVGLRSKSARAAARSAADLRRELRARGLTAPHHLLRDTVAWTVVRRRQHMEQGWTVLLAVPPAMLSLIALERLGLGWLVVTGVFLPLFSLLGLCLLLLALDTRAVERGQSDERLRSAIVCVLRSSVERFGSRDRRSQFRLTEALRALDAALADHARSGVSLFPGDQRALLGQAAGMSHELHRRFRVTAQRPEALRDLAEAATRLLEAVQAQRYLDLVSEEEGRAHEPDVVVDVEAGRRTVATGAAFVLAVAAVFLAQWLGVSGEGMALIAPTVIAVTQIPHLLLLRAEGRAAGRAVGVQQPEVPGQRTGDEPDRPELSARRRPR